MFHPISPTSITKLVMTLGMEGFTASPVLLEETRGGNTYVVADEKRLTIDLARVNGMSLIVLEVNLESNTLTVRTASESVEVVGYHYNGGQLCFRESNDPAVEFLTIDHNPGTVVWHRNGDRTQAYATPRAQREEMFQSRIDALIEENRSLRPAVDVESTF